MKRILFFIIAVLITFLFKIDTPVTKAAQMRSVGEPNDTLHVDFFDFLQSALPDSQVGLINFTTEAIDFISSGGSITNNPDGVTLETKPGSTIGIKNGGVSNVHIAWHGIADTSKFSKDVVNSYAILNGTIDSIDVAENSINYYHIQDGGVGSDQLANNSVNTMKILDYSIWGNDIVSGSINNNHLTVGAVGDSTKLAADVVTTTKILDTTIDSSDIDTAAIKNLHYATSSIDYYKLNSDLRDDIDKIMIADDITLQSYDLLGVIYVQIKADGIDSTRYADASIYTNHIIDGAITNDKMGIASVSSSNIINSSILWNDLSDAVKDSIQSAGGTASDSTFYSINLVPTDAPLHDEGLVYYDSTTKALSYYNEESDVTINIGQELFIPVWNNSGSTIADGKPVILTGSFNGLPTIGLAASSTKDSSHVSGVTTHSIEDGTRGYITVLGTVRSINTSAFSLGDRLYQSSTKGVLTATRPTDGEFPTYVAWVSKVGTTDGEIVVNPDVEEVPDAIIAATGIQNNNSSTIGAGGASSNYFKITPTGSNFYWFDEGVKFSRYVADSIAIPDAEGMYIAYYDCDTLKIGLASVLDAESLISESVLLAYIYWDDTNNKIVYIGDERHGFNMSTATHEYLHRTRGAQWVSGYALGDIYADLTAVSDTAAQWSSTAGIIADEDLFHGGIAVSRGTTVPVAYLIGSGYMRTDTTSTFALLTTGTGRLAYNQYTGGAWQLTEVPNGDYVLYHLFATNSFLDRKITAVMGQNTYTNIINARAGAISEISSLVTAFEVEEAVPIATIIYQTNNSYANTVKARVRSTDIGETYIDWRKTELEPGAAPSNHANLAGLEWGGSGHNDSNFNVNYNDDGAVNIGTITSQSGYELNVNGDLVATTGKVDSLYIDTDHVAGNNKALLIKSSTASANYESIVFEPSGYSQYSTEIINRLAEVGQSWSLYFTLYNKDAIGGANVDTALAMVGNHVLINPLSSFTTPTVTDSIFIVNGGVHIAGGLLVDYDINAETDLYVQSNQWNTGTDINGDKLLNDSVDDDALDFTSITVSDFTNDAGYLTSIPTSYIEDIDSTVIFATPYQLNLVIPDSTDWATQYDLTQYLPLTGGELSDQLTISSETSPILQIDPGTNTTVDPTLYLKDTSTSAGFKIWYDNSEEDTYLDNKSSTGDIRLRTNVDGTPNYNLILSSNGNNGHYYPGSDLTASMQGWEAPYHYRFYFNQSNDTPAQFYSFQTNSTNDSSGIRIYNRYENRFLQLAFGAYDAKIWNNYGDIVINPYSGFLGVKTSTPTADVHVADSTGTASITLETLNSGSGAIFQLLAYNNASSVIRMGDNDDVDIQQIVSDNVNNELEFYTNNALVMTLQSDGDAIFEDNVAICTSSSISELTVESASNISPQLTLSSLTNNGISANEQIGGIDFYSNDPDEQGVGARIQTVADGASHSVGSISSRLEFYTAYGTTLGLGMFLDKNAHFGVNVSSTTAQAHIKRDSYGGTYSEVGTLVLENSTNNYLTILSPNTDNGILTFGDPENFRAGRLQYYHGLDEMYIYTNNTKQVTINSSGFMGIGITPTELFEVDGGTARFDSIYVERGIRQVDGMSYFDELYVSNDLYSNLGTTYTDDINVTLNAFVGRDDYTCYKAINSPQNDLLLNSRDEIIFSIDTDNTTTTSGFFWKKDNNSGSGTSLAHLGESGTFRLYTGDLMMYNTKITDNSYGSFIQVADDTAYATNFYTPSNTNYTGGFRFYSSSNYEIPIFTITGAGSVVIDDYKTNFGGVVIGGDSTYLSDSFDLQVLGASKFYTTLYTIAGISVTSNTISYDGTANALTFNVDDDGFFHNDLNIGGSGYDGGHDLYVGDNTTFSYIDAGATQFTNTSDSTKKVILKDTDKYDLSLFEDVFVKDWHFKADRIRRKFEEHKPRKYEELSDSMKVVVASQWEEKEDARVAEEISKIRSSHMAQDIGRMKGEPNAIEINNQDVINILWLKLQETVARVDTLENTNAKLIKRIEQLEK